MKKWQILLKYEEEKEKALELFDAARYFDGYLKIKRSYFNGLLNSIKTSKNYFSGRAIEKVISPEEEDWILNPWILMMIKDKEKQKRFWFLIRREEDLSGLLIAIGPKEFADYNYNNSEAKREIMRIFNYAVAYVTKFNVILLLPNYLS
ncbi:MAG: hypothetical protein BAJALOKI1v1_1930001 [Promethearchaeota archaeon]|nr:MAG: hypothetical protein BAJALOKI1v1_1930001 [Candidatus Lokiarchaeota archaeon]